MSKRVHHHRCQGCDTKTECHGDIEQNYDGFPEWICAEFHMGSGIGQMPYVNPDFVCDHCAEKREQREQADLRANL